MASSIEPEQIPKIQLDILSRTLLAAMERFFADPENLNGYEQWLQGEEGRAYAAQDARPCANSLS